MTEEVEEITDIKIDYGENGVDGVRMGGGDKFNQAYGGKVPTNEVVTALAKTVYGAQLNEVRKTLEQDAQKKEKLETREKIDAYVAEHVKEYQSDIETAVEITVKQIVNSPQDYFQALFRIGSQQVSVLHQASQVYEDAETILTAVHDYAETSHSQKMVSIIGKGNLAELKDLAKLYNNHVGEITEKAKEEGKK